MIILMIFFIITVLIIYLLIGLGLSLYFDYKDLGKLTLKKYQIYFMFLWPMYFLDEYF